MKDEVNGKTMKESVGLSAKMYAFGGGLKAKTKAKSVKKCVIDKEITFENRRFLFDQRELCKKMNLIRSYKHDIHLI
jgi:hypothetical protein